MFYSDDVFCFYRLFIVSLLSLDEKIYRHYSIVLKYDFFPKQDLYKKTI